MHWFSKYKMTQTVPTPGAFWISSFWSCKLVKALVILVCAKTNGHIKGHIGPENVFEIYLAIDVTMGPSYWTWLTFLTPCQKERVTHVLLTWRWTYLVVCSVCRTCFLHGITYNSLGSCTTFCFPMFDIMGFKKEWRLIVSEEQKDFNGVFTFNERFTIHLVVKARENSSHKIEIYFIQKLLLLS